MSEAAMQEYRIKWQACPRINNPSRVIFLKASSPEAAKMVAEDHIERTYGLNWYVIDEVKEYTKPTGGVVLSG